MFVAVINLVDTDSEEEGGEAAVAAPAQIPAHAAAAAPAQTPAHAAAPAQHAQHTQHTQDASTSTQDDVDVGLQRLLLAPLQVSPVVSSAVAPAKPSSSGDESDDLNPSPAARSNLKNIGQNVCESVLSSLAAAAAAAEPLESSALTLQAVMPPPAPRPAYFPTLPTLPDPQTLAASLPASYFTFPSTSPSALPVSPALPPSSHKRVPRAHKPAENSTSTSPRPPLTRSEHTAAEQDALNDEIIITTLDELQAMGKPTAAAVSKVAAAMDEQRVHNAGVQALLDAANAVADD